MKRFAPGTTLLCLVALAATSGPVRAAEIVDGTLTYHVDHRFKSFDAVMPASAAELALTVDPAAIEALTFTARIPLGSFDSGNQLRDEHAAEALELFLFANASWTAESVEVLTRDPADGPARQARVRVSGPLVLRGEIRPPRPGWRSRVIRWRSRPASPSRSMSTESTARVCWASRPTTP